MSIEEKRKRLEEVFELQKSLMKNLRIDNFFDTLQKVRKLELQKEMIKAIPSLKSNDATQIIKTFGDQINRCAISIQKAIVANQPKA